VPVPAECPSCAAAVVREKDFLFCSAPRTCRRALIGQIGHYAATCDMLGFGDGILQQAYDAGLLRSAADFYSLRWEDLANLDRCGEKIAKKLVAEVDKKRTLELATFLRALGIAELGKHVSAILAAQYRTIDAVLAVGEEELAATHSIGETIARSVVKGLAESRAAIEALRAHVEITGPATTGGAEGALSGKSFVFTGKMMNVARSEAEKRVRALGGGVLSAVNKSLTYLVVGADRSGPKSTKEKAADKLIGQGAPIRILSEEELLAMLEGTSGS
jgi:DNA ligase (NAD+)